MQEDYTVYCLEIDIPDRQVISVGALGELHFDAGLYLYTGSAQRNFMKRIQRHCARQKNIRWHIDYVTSAPGISITGIYGKSGLRDQECLTADFLTETELPVKGFGSSDCKCNAHLFKVSSKGIPEEIGYRAVKLL